MGIEERGSGCCTLLPSAVDFFALTRWRWCLQRVRATLTLHLTLHPLLGKSRYDGLEDPTAPVLAVGLDNGRVQLMRGEHYEKLVLLDTSLRATKLRRRRWFCQSTMVEEWCWWYVALILYVCGVD